ncbi:MAG: translation repressor RelB [Eggerthellaceae bacterium]|nr:translation repressor RelB [Eggerthellaceae bacterium]
MAIQSQTVTKSAQMNVRMERALLEAGNAALAEMGITPSQAVRALWEKLAKRGKDREAVQTVLFTPEVSAEKQREDALDLVKKGHQIVDDFYRSMGIDPSTLPVEDFPSYEEIREEALFERMKERGIWLE